MQSARQSLEIFFKNANLPSYSMLSEDNKKRKGKTFSLFTFHSSHYKSSNVKFTLFQTSALRPLSLLILSRGKSREREAWKNDDDEEDKKTEVEAGADDKLFGTKNDIKLNKKSKEQTKKEKINLSGHFLDQEWRLHKITLYRKSICDNIVTSWTYSSCIRILSES